MNLIELENQIKELKSKKSLNAKEKIDLKKLEKEYDKLTSPIEASGVFVSDSLSNDNSRLSYIKVDKISMNPNQPRIVFDEDKLLELSESIKLHGLLEPIVVADMDGSYTLIAGERRYKAHILAGIDEIKAIVVKGMTDLMIKELAIIENIQREDLNCIEFAIAAKQLQDSFGYTIRQLEERLNKDKNFIHFRLKVLEFSEENLEFIIMNKLFNVSLLNEILRCDKDKHKKLLEDMAANKLTAKLVKETNADKNENKVAPKKEVNSFPYGLKPITGVKIKSDKKKLALEINYNDFAGKDIEKIKEYLQEIIEQSLKGKGN